jgi:hypothetical protein
MPTVKRFGNVKIHIPADDHFPRHFHIMGPGWAVWVLMETMEIRRGVLPPWSC